jgi:predicted RNase H-like nuclease (RuvC/YqgF family)
VRIGIAGEFLFPTPVRPFVNARTSALDSLVFGVDVQSGDVRGDAPSYALVEFDSEDLTRDVVSHRKLRRRIDAAEPALVATDNMYELAADKDALVRLLASLPDGTSLVQVTGAERPEPLSRVAGRHGVPYGKKPMKEAEAAARLAAAGVGHEVTAFADTTTVKVARGRSTGGGGWSQDRYTRRIHGNVKKRSREVESDLDAANLDYEQEVTEKYGGYQNAVFTVEAPPEDIPVSANRSGDTRVEVERERRDGIEFEPLVERRDRVVVGIDPGTTTAAAVLDLDGGVLDVYSTRTDDVGDVIEWLVERGRPVVVAADVTPMPETVERFRRSFDAGGWTPESDLPVDEKLHRTEGVPYDNDHERDALAAALFAFDDHEDQFDRIARKVPAGLDHGEVIERVVGSEASVESVLRDLRDDGDDEADGDEHEERELTEEERRIRELERRVERLRDHADDLRDELADKEDRIEGLEAELSDARREERREARRDREVTRLQRENDRLERQRDEAREEVGELERKLARLKTLWKLDHDDFTDVAEGRDVVPVKVVEQFTKDAIRHADDQYGLASGDVVYFRDASGAGRATAERLAATDPRIVLRTGGLSDAADEVLFDHDIPVGPAADVEMQEVDDLAVARESDVRAAIDDWEERARERRRERTAEMVDEIISEHRAGSGD